jgi:hypothetical protein
MFLIALAGCATTHGSLTSSADRLERSADVLARDSSGDSYSYSREARELADQSHDFRRTVTDRRADDRDVKDAFDALSRDYHALRDRVDRANSHQASLDLRPVTEAYLDIEREVGTDRDGRYAEDRRSSHDRY